MKIGAVNCWDVCRFQSKILINRYMFCLKFKKKTVKENCIYNGNNGYFETNDRF